MGGVWESLAREMDPRPSGRVLAGFSGGADSTALMMLLLFLREAGELQPEAVHVNHGLRGEEAEADAAFAESFCRERDIPFHLYRVDLQERRDENAARQARYACFRACAQSAGIRQLVLAHHRGDQAETFLLRLLRGAGPEGLACMRPREERDGYTILRPLLRMDGAELRQALRQEGIPWREDGSNAGDDYLRNRIRHRLLPEMESLIPGAGARIARAAEMIGEENEALNARLPEIPERSGRDGYLPLSALAGLAEAEKRQVLRSFWRLQGPALAERNPDYEQTRAFSALAEAEAGERINLPGGWLAERGRKGLHLLNPEREAPAPVPYRREGTVFGEMTLATLPSRGNPGDGKRSQEVPPDFPEGCEIRTRRAGDWIRPFGMAGRKSLQDYLTDRKTDAPFRDRIPLLCRGSEVLWAAGVGAGDVPRWQKDQEHIRLEWRGCMPWAGEGKEQYGYEG